jgi:propanol-preferring alcohol dehydrogenase
VYTATPGWDTLCESQLNTGYSIAGTHAEYAIVYAKHIVKVPDGVTPLNTAPLTCAGVTTSKAVKVSGARPDLVAIFGISGLGHLALKYVKVAGASVVAVDLFDEKLQLAKALGGLCGQCPNPRPCGRDQESGRCRCGH